MPSQLGVRGSGVENDHRWCAVFFRCVEPIDVTPYRPQKRVLAYQCLAVLMLTVLVSEGIKAVIDPLLSYLYLSRLINGPRTREFQANTDWTLSARTDLSALTHLGTETVVVIKARRSAAEAAANQRNAHRQRLIVRFDAPRTNGARAVKKTTYSSFLWGFRQIDSCHPNMALSVTESGAINDNKLIEMYLRADRGLVDGQTGKRVSRDH